jgi:hypothetical protein
MLKACGTDCNQSRNCLRYKLPRIAIRAGLELLAQVAIEFTCRCKEKTIYNKLSYYLTLQQVRLITCYDMTPRVPPTTAHQHHTRHSIADPYTNL